MIDTTLKSRMDDSAVRQLSSDTLESIHGTISMMISSSMPEGIFLIFNKISSNKNTAFVLQSISGAVRERNNDMTGLNITLPENCNFMNSTGIYLISSILKDKIHIRGNTSQENQFRHLFNNHDIFMVPMNGRHETHFLYCILFPDMRYTTMLVSLSDIFISSAMAIEQIMANRPGNSKQTRDMIALPGRSKTSDNRSSKKESIPINEDNPGEKESVNHDGTPEIDIIRTILQKSLLSGPDLSDLLQTVCKYYESIGLYYLQINELTDSGKYITISKELYNQIPGPDSPGNRCLECHMNSMYFSLHGDSDHRSGKLSVPIFEVGENKCYEFNIHHVKLIEFDNIRFGFVSIICDDMNTTRLNELQLVNLALAGALYQWKVRNGEFDNAQKNGLKDMAWSNFLANLSHEIRTPMNSIIGYVNMLDEKLNDKKLKTYTERIKNASSSLLQILNDIIDFSRLESGKISIHKDPVSMHQIIGEVWRSVLREEKPESVQFNNDIPEDFPLKIEMDEQKLKQILFNLLSNSLKFTSNGTVSVVVRLKRIYRESIDFSISVIDTGSGISNQDIPLLMDGYQTISDVNRKQNRGVGLGLPIVHQLTRLMNGKLDVKNNPNRGTMFTVSFSGIPILSENDSWFHTLPITDPGEIKVFAIDDMEENLFVLKKAFRNLGCIIETEQNPVRALNKIMDFKPHLIFVDRKMPYMDGLILARKIKEIQHLQDTHIILLSASNPSDDSNEFDSRNRPLFTTSLNKPIKSYTVTNLLRKLFPDLSIESDDSEEEDAISSRTQEQNSHLPCKKPLSQEATEYVKPLIDQIRYARKTMILSELKKISDELIDAGNRRRVEQLVLTGEKLKESITSYNFRNMKCIINKLESRIMTGD